MVEQCLQIVRTCTGQNGDPVIFNSRMKKDSHAILKHPNNSGGKPNDTISVLASLGVAATSEQVERTITELPAVLNEPGLIRQLFLALRNGG